MRFSSTLIAVATIAVAVPLSASASAAAPRFGVFDLGAGLAKASQNVYGDVQVSASRASLARRARGATIVRCAGDCRLGRGWLAFAKAPLLTARDVDGAVRDHVGVVGWSVSVRLTPRGETRLKQLLHAASSQKARTGLPPVYAVVLHGTIYAAPLATQLRVHRATLELTGFSRAGAKRAVGLIP